MRRLQFSLLVCVLAGCAANQAADNAGDSGRAGESGSADDARGWQGTWKLVSCVANGESEMGNVQWVVSGDHYTIRVDGKSGNDPYTFTLDPKQKRIDVFHHDTPQGTYGGRLNGIYDLQGSSLKVCYDLKGQHYPASFDASRGSGQVVYQLQR